MNNYIALLKKEEKETLCEIITGQEFKSLFISNEREFSKIQPGFRAKTLGEQRALSIAKAHVQNPFIAMWINLKVERWLNEIQENIDKLEKEEVAHDIALANTLLDSVFHNNIPLYFKLIEQPLDVRLLSKIYGEMMSLKCERIKSVGKEEYNKLLEEKQQIINQIKDDYQQYKQMVNAEINERIKNFEAKNQQDINKLEVAHEQNISELKSKYQQEIRDIENEKSKVELSLAKAQEQIEKFQSNNTSDEYTILVRFDDTNDAFLPSLGSENFISLCIVKRNSDGQKYLIRCADLNPDGNYYIFYQNENLPPVFGNRIKIFCKNTSLDEGSYGIWNWEARPNEKDSRRDFVLSDYNDNLDPIEVVKVPEISSLDELVARLKSGIDYQKYTRRVMFAFYNSNGQYVGILCKTKELCLLNGKAIFAEDCFEVPIYEFSNDDIIQLNAGICFYKKAFAGIPIRLYQLKSKLDIVKSVILSSISWDKYKTKGFVKTDYKIFKDFIAEIPVDDIIIKISAACRCSISDAKELLNKLLKIVWRYIDGDSLEDKILLSAISVSTELQERIKELLRKDWETENKQLFDAEKEKLSLLKTELKSVSSDLSEAKESYNKTKMEKEQFETIIAEKEKLAEDVEVAVAERIQKARQNAADFIANMAFVSGPSTNVVSSETAAKVEESTSTYKTTSLLENLVDPVLHHSWSDVINTAIFELGEAGVAEKYRNGLAAFLCAAYIEKQPIMLIGPNAIDIAKVFVAVVAGNKFGTLCCDGSYSNHVLKEIGTNGEDIVIINNLFTSEWMNRIPEIFSRKDIFYIATHPYPEDIQVEPKSLYGFMLPLFTEFFVDAKATGEYDGGYFAEDFEAYTSLKCVHNELKGLVNLKLSTLIRNRINGIIATMHGIYPETTDDDDFLFGILPIAYASLAINELKEAIADPNKGIAISLDIKRDLNYILGES